MSALSDLQKKLEQEAQGIMFPFSANANTVSTTQNAVSYTHLTLPTNREV